MKKAGLKSSDSASAIERDLLFHNYIVIPESDWPLLDSVLFLV